MDEQKNIGLKKKILKSMADKYFRVSVDQLIELRDAALEAGRAEILNPNSENHYKAVEREGAAFKSCQVEKIGYVKNVH
jgi:hypothetical protein